VGLGYFIVLALPALPGKGFNPENPLFAAIKPGFVPVIYGACCLQK
jgi:hypothetical protein